MIANSGKKISSFLLINVHGKLVWQVYNMCNAHSYAISTNFKFEINFKRCQRKVSSSEIYFK